MKQKTGTLAFVIAFILVWACTPSSLLKSPRQTAATTAAVVTGAATGTPQDSGMPTAAEHIDSLAAVAGEDTSAPQDAEIADSTVAGASLEAGAGEDARAPLSNAPLDAETPDSTAAVAGEDASAPLNAGDSLAIGRDTVPPPPLGSGAPAAAALKRDTTTMDSLELAIYKYNMVIDDSLRRDSLNRQKKNGIDAPVKFSANDSLIYVAATGMAHLFGSAHVEYQNMDLKSEKIYMCLDSSLVHATGKLDSTTNRLTGNPVFKMGNDTYESDTMAFNFKTKKGLIQQVYTQQEDGFLTSEISKRGANGELYLQHGRYTTCDAPHPDFYIAMSRAKVRPGRDVVFGPSYLVVCDVPIPLAIPYGFFPFTQSYSSGFIMPTYGDETSRGFYLRDGGYYFAISDKMDLKLIGEIYTKGSWGLTGTSNYRKRYRYSGSILASYQNSVSGEKNLPDYSKTTSFKVQWSHRQDAKANPFSTFSASVNFATSSYEKNNLTSMYNPQAMTQSTRTSNVSYTVNFSSLGLSLSSQMSINQNMRDTSVALTMPDLNITVSRFYPFRRKKMVGKERWYEKISMSYTGHITNSINTKEDLLLHSNLIKDWKNGMTHSIPINANFMLFGNINLNPSISFQDRTYTTRVMKSWDEVAQKEVNDTTYGFYNVYNWSLSLTASTKLYGQYIPSRKIFGDKIDRIRHVFTPSVGFTYAPDFGAKRYGYYKTYQKTDADGNVTLVEYSPYTGGFTAPPGQGKTGSLNFSMSNNIEMRVKSDEDSTGFKKISIIDELGANMSYNMAAKRQPWSSLNTTLRLKLTKSYTFNLSAVFASYVYEVDSVGGTPHESDFTTYWGQGKIGRFQGMSQNLSYTIDNKKLGNIIKWLKGERPPKEDKKKKKKSLLDEEDEDDYDENEVDTNIDRDLEKGKDAAEREKAETDDDGYMGFQLPWSLSFGYGITMSEDHDVSRFNYHTMRYPYKFTQNLNISGSIRISDGWNISFSSGYDFENKKISMTTASLNRDLHCFNMSCSVVLAPYTSYNFSFRCNASTLTDALKYDKRSSYSSTVQWY